MGIVGSIIFGAIVYVIGFVIHRKHLLRHQVNHERFSLTHPLIIKYLLACFVIMLAVSALVGRFLLNHETFDWAFIIINSLIATVVFYFGLNPDTTQMNLPN
ncbi:hypothetical protein LU276_04160 [Moraxella haemolytica]|uniref:hypothetical protein n=1 Tax=Moraxella TaxID=475 RepID=UPI002543A02C|nr:hypothetical protein [Moraxella sp. ZY171148]WII96016.1 hypothetical protein LU276_04160 [Moraxella sp. ZY171148]